jgi:hypothetical protein
MIKKLILHFDPRKSAPKKKYHQIFLHLYGIDIVDDKKKTVDYSKQVEISDTETDEEDHEYEFVVTINEGKNKALKRNKSFQF